jgi:hypothetical protein
LFVLDVNALQVGGEVPFGHRGEHRDAVLVALAAADDDLIGGEVDVLDAQATTLEDAQARSVKQAGHEPWRAVEPVEHNTDFVTGRDDWKALRAFGAYGVVEPGQGDVEHVAVEEQERAQRLVLRGGRDATLHRQRAEECGDLGRVALAVKEDVAPDPGDVGLFGTTAVVAGAKRGADAVEETRLGPVHRAALPDGVRA